MIEAAAERCRSLGTAVGKDTQPGIHEGANQPRPDGSLVIGGVARPDVAVVARLKVGVIGRQRAQPDGRQQPLGNHADDLLPAIPRKDGMRK